MRLPRETLVGSAEYLKRIAELAKRVESGHADDIPDELKKGQSEGSGATVIITRVDAKGCSTTMNASLSVGANRDFNFRITRTGGGCGLSPGYTENRVWKQ